MRNTFDRRNQNLRDPHQHKPGKVSTGPRGGNRDETRARLIAQHDLALSMLRGSGYKSNNPLYRLAVDTLRKVTRYHIDEAVQYHVAFEAVCTDTLAGRYDDFGESLHDLLKLLKELDDKAFRMKHDEHARRYNNGGKHRRKAA